MIKWIRSITVIVALLYMGTGVFLIDAPTEMARASYAYRHQDMDQAMRHARRAVFSSKDDRKIMAQALKIESAVAIKLDHREEAITFLGQAILIEPDCSLCYLQRGDLLYSQKNYPAAIHDFEKGLQMNSVIENKIKAYYFARQGLSFLAVGENKRAHMISQKARSFDPGSPLAHFLESKVLIQRENIKGAYFHAYTAYQLGQKKARFFSSSEGDSWLRYYASVKVRYNNLGK